MKSTVKNHQSKEYFISHEFASFINDHNFADIPQDVVQRAKYLILDAVGIAFASTQYDFAHRTLSALSEFGTGKAKVIGLSTTLSMRDAVRLNGLLIHGLDYDDTHVGGVIHATASCLPTALGVAAHRRQN